MLYGKESRMAHIIEVSVKLAESIPLDLIVEWSPGDRGVGDNGPQINSVNVYHGANPVDLSDIDIDPEDYFESDILKAINDSGEETEFGNRHDFCQEI